MKKITYKEQLDYINSFRREDDPLVREMESFAYENNVPILDSLTAGFLEKLVKWRKPKSILEIGTAIAYTSIRLAKQLDAGSVLYTIEKSFDNLKLAKTNIDKAGLGSIIKVLEGDALEILPGMQRKFDLIFLDADKEVYGDLLQKSVNLLETGGMLFVDNLLWQGYAAVDEVPENYIKSTEAIRQFNKKFMNHPELETEIVPIGDGAGIGIKK